MRINVYSQELTNETAMVRKTGKNSDGETEDFYGVRLYLASLDSLHNVPGDDDSVPDDDDRSAITLWLPRSISRTAALAITLHRMADLVTEMLAEE